MRHTFLFVLFSCTLLPSLLCAEFSEQDFESLSLDSFEVATSSSIFSKKKEPPIPAYPLIPTCYAYPQRRSFITRIKGALVKPPKQGRFSQMILDLFGKKYSLDESTKRSFWNRLKLIFASAEVKKLIGKLKFKLAKHLRPVDSLERGQVSVATDGSFYFDSLSLPPESAPYEFLDYQLAYVDDDGMEKLTSGKVQVIPDDPYAWSIVTDIDDTIRWTGVIKPYLMFKTSFLEPFRDINGMQKLFINLGQKLAGKQHPTVYHYLSGAPVAFLEANQKFLDDFKYPPGPLHFQVLAVDNAAAVKNLAGVVRFKISELQKIMDDLPHRNYIWLGDSGQSDPEVYATAYRAMNITDPSNSPCIYIRAVTGVDASKEKDLNSKTRFRWDFRGVPAHRWMVFNEASELEDIDPRSGSCYPPGKVNPLVDPGMENELTEPVKDSKGREIKKKESFNEAAVRLLNYVQTKFNNLFSR